MVDTVNSAVLPPPSDTDPQYIKNISQIWADKAEQERLAMERARAVDLYNKATDGVKYNSYSEEIEGPTADPTIGYSPEYFASERDRVKALLAQKKAAHEAKYDARGSLFSGLRSELVPEVRALQQQYNELDRSYEMARQRSEQQAMTMARARAARDVNNKLAAAGINERVSYRDVPDTQAAQYINKNNVPAPQQAVTNVATTIANAANATVGSMFGVPTTQATTTTTEPAAKSSQPAVNTATTATTDKPAATTTTQSTRTDTPTATQTTRATPTATQTTRATPTATTGGGVYQGGLPPKQTQPVVQQPMVQQPVPQQPVPQPVVGYVPPPVRDGYDMVGSAKQAFVPGTPISENVARAMYKMQNETNTARNQMMSSARTSQVMDAMNNPDTYRVAEMFARQGMPMDQAMHLAMTQTTAANGDWLGVGATIPAGQKALSDMNDRNMQFSFMFGIPWEAREVSGPVYMGNPYFRAMNPNGTIVTTDGTKTGLNNSQMMFAAAGANNPLAANQAVVNADMQSQVNFTNMINKNSYGNSGNGGGSNKAVSEEATQLIKNADKKAEENTTPTPTNTIPGL